MSSDGEIPCGDGFLYPGACSDMCGSPYWNDDKDPRIGHECCSTVADEVVRLRQRVGGLYEALRISRDNIRTLNAVRQDRGIRQFDSWLVMVEAAMASAGRVPCAACGHGYRSAPGEVCYECRVEGEPRCPGCGVVVEAKHMWCTRCWPKENAR